MFSNSLFLNLSTKLRTFWKNPPLLQIVLICILIVRGISLEFGDLIDPTETRYATIAENMIFSGDWTTPRLPTENGLEPYLSKPPLHFWLTALSYKFFGIDEWTSRLPSYLALLLMLSSIIVYARYFFTKEIGYAASIICASSPLMFFLSGSSTVDVTFAAFTTAALTTFAITIAKKDRKQKSLGTGILFYIFSALAFLTKGPAAIILIGLPILILCYFEKSIKSLTSLPWVIGTLIFALISVPWFYFVERATPGSVSYFFLHENFLRFLTKDYGGRHGAAHIQPYGSIWWMMALAMLPWTFFLIKKPGLIFSKQIFSKLRKLDKWYVFVLACAFAPIVFFTFARSILPAYTLPAIPGLSLIIAKSIFSLESTNKEIKFKRLAKLFLHPFRPNLTANLGAAIVTIMMAGFYLSKPYIEVNKSSSELLEVIADNTKAKHPVVGIISTNNYSPYWTSGAHLEELSKPVRVIYVKPDEIENSKVKHLAVRESNNTNFLDNYGKHFERIALIGKWSWYRRK